MSVKIIVDSTVDLVPEVKAQMSAVVPLSVRFGEEEYKDGVTITAQKFYEMLAKNETLPTTSQPTPAAFEEAYAKATADGSQVIVITLSSKLSGTYQSATIAAEDYEGKVFVVDSRSAAIGAGILTEYALGLSRQGLSGEEILNILIGKRKQIRLFFMVDTLEYLHKGGRLNGAVAVVGGLLNIKPILHVDETGEIKMLSSARGQKKAFATLTELSSQDGGPNFEEPVMLAYTGVSDENLEKYMAENTQLWAPDTAKTIVGSAIGVHAGPGAVAVSFFAKNG